MIKMFSSNNPITRSIGLLIYTMGIAVAFTCIEEHEVLVRWIDGDGGDAMALSLVLIAMAHAWVVVAPTFDEEKNDVRPG